MSIILLSYRGSEGYVIMAGNKGRDYTALGANVWL